jgi:hypothetical protein
MLVPFGCLNGSSRAPTWNGSRPVQFAVHYALSEVAALRTLSPCGHFHSHCHTAAGMRQSGQPRRPHTAILTALSRYSRPFVIGRSGVLTSVNRANRPRLAATPHPCLQSKQVLPWRRLDVGRPNDLTPSAGTGGLRLGGAGQQPRHDSLMTIAATGELMFLSRLRRKGGSLLFGLSTLPG